MPHNLYLHSSIVQTRRYEESAAGKRMAVRYAFVDSTVALSLALFINAAILIVAAATFHRAGHTDVAEIQQAYQLLTPLLGVTGASAVFAFALLASGQNSTLTGTLAGQIVMEGFLNIRIRPWPRRLITRLIAIVPAALTAIFFGGHGTAQLLIRSQVILSLQLSFAFFPLVMFTSDRLKMGEFVNPTWLKILADIVAVFIETLNTYLLVRVFAGWVGWSLSASWCRSKTARLTLPFSSTFAGWQSCSVPRCCCCTSQMGGRRGIWSSSTCASRRR